MKKFLEEFKLFAIKGNVIDLSVAVIIGGAFGKITTSLVNDIIMPPIGILLGNVNFASLQIMLKGATETAPEVAILYGQFLQTVINFVIIAISVFVVVKVYNKLQKKEEAKPTQKGPSQEELLTEIRDLLKK